MRAIDDKAKETVGIKPMRCNPWDVPLCNTQKKFFREEVRYEKREIGILDRSGRMPKPSILLSIGK